MAIAVSFLVSIAGSPVLEIQKDPFLANDPIMLTGKTSLPSKN